jgi:hypothetical protein
MPSIQGRANSCMYACDATTTKSDLFLLVRCFLKLFGMSSRVNALECRTGDRNLGLLEKKDGVPIASSFCSSVFFRLSVAGSK